MATKNKEILLNTKGFLTALKQTHLSGIIEECEVNIKKGKGIIEAIDISNQIIVFTEQKIITNRKVNMPIGLSNLDLLIKFVQSLDSEGEEVAVEFGRRNMLLKAQQKKRMLDYILTEPDLIMTRPDYDEEDESPKEKILNLMEYKASLSYSSIKDFLSYIGLLKSKETKVSIWKKKIKFICGGELEHQITIDLDDRANKKAEGFSVKVNGEHLARVFQTIDYDQDEPPEIHLANQKPVVIICGKATWALMPLIELGEEDEDAGE